MKNISNDHRTRVTRLLIRKSFMELLSKEPIQNITIKELCNLAGINRGTFYHHYDDIYDLLHQIEDKLLADLQSALMPLLLTADKEWSPSEICTEIFRCLKENSDICIVMLGEYSDKKFVDELLQMGKKWCILTYSQYFKKTPQRQIEYYYSFVSSGCVGLLRQWLDEGLSAAPEEIADMAEKIMLRGIGFFQPNS